MKQQNFSYGKGFVQGALKQAVNPCHLIPPVLIREWAKEMGGEEAKKVEKIFNLPDLSNVPQKNLDNYINGYDKGSDIVYMGRSFAVFAGGLGFAAYALSQTINWDYFLK